MDNEDGRRFRGFGESDIIKETMEMWGEENCEVVETSHGVLVVFNPPTPFDLRANIDKEMPW